MNWLKENWFKVGIILAIVSFGAFYYSTQISRQESLERQEHFAERNEYISKRTRDCLEIYKVEDEKWTNVVGWHYREPSTNPYDAGWADKCVVEYKNKETSETFEKDF